MKKQQLTRWQVILGVIGFLLILGAVGKLDYDSAVAVEEAKNQQYLIEIMTAEVK